MNVPRVLALLIVAALAGPAVAQTPEFRAMWVTRFEWPNADPVTCRATIDRIMSDLKNAHFNAVVFQIRGQADVLYPSPYEVWSPLIGGVDPGWDTLTYAVNAAHANGLEFHAYMNTHVCWQSPTVQLLPTNPDHILYDHCYAADPQHRDWLHHKVADNPVQFSESDYVWFAPGVPAFQAYIRQQILYVAQNYDVDGIHFDRIRTPWSGEPSYDPISQARFADPQSNPDGLDISHWTADQISRNVRDMYAAVMAVKPRVKMSAAVYPDSQAAPANQHQAALLWAQTGGMDMLIPMMYSAGGSGSTWDVRLQQWLAGSAGRHLVPGHNTSQGLASLLEQIALARTRGAQGNNVFSWSSFTWWNDYVSGVYSAPVATPAMPWKDNPTTGIVYGFIRDAGAAPVTDAQVRRAGSSYAGLSTADGFYSLLLVPTGPCDLTVSHRGYAPVSVASFNVGAGEVIRKDITFGPLKAPVIAEVDPDPQNVYTGLEYVRHLVLSQGTADTWTLVQGPPGAVVNAYGRVAGWHPTTGDIGQTVAFTVRATNSVDADEESWGVVATSEPPRYSFSLLVDEYGTGSCTTDEWEWVGVTSVAGWAPQGTPLFTNSAVWQTVDVPLDNPSLVRTGLNGNGQLAPSPSGYYTIDSVWFTIAPGAGAEGVGPWEVYIDAVQLVDSTGAAGKTILNMEDGVNRLQNSRGQSPVGPTSSALSDAASYDGARSHRLEWKYTTTDAGQSIGMLQRVSLTCGTGALVEDESKAIRFHLLCRGRRVNPDVPLPAVVGPIVGTQSTVRVTHSGTATALQLYVNGLPRGSAVTPTGEQTDLAGLTLQPGDSVSARQTIGGVESDWAYVKGVSAAPMPPAVQGPIPPGATSVTVTNALTVPHATASAVTVYANGAQVGSAPGGTATVIVTTSPLSDGAAVTATQTVNGAVSGLSEPVTVAVPAPVIYKAPARNDTSVRVMKLVPGTTLVTITVNGTPTFTAVPASGSAFADVPVNGLVAGDTMKARAAVGAAVSADSASETVTTDVTTDILCDNFEYDEATYTTRWANSASPRPTLSADKNATYPAGTRSVYVGAGKTGDTGAGRIEKALSNTTPTATKPIVWNVNIFDAYGPGASNVQFAQLNGGSWFQHVGMLSWSPQDTNYYQYRANGNGGPNWVDLNQYDAPRRSIGWHNFTVVHKGRIIDVYVDGLLARKNISLTSTPTMNRARIGPGYDSEHDAWYDDFCVQTGPVRFLQALPDCNHNGVGDDRDIDAGTSKDCDTNGVPDECQTDCNDNDVADACDIADGTSEDCNTNKVPDECDVDAGTSKDCNANGVPDECEPDCNHNGVADACDIAAGTSDDCDGNKIPDECQPDRDGDGLVDACDACPDSHTGRTIVIDGCDSGVANVMPGTDGCTMSDQIAECAEEAANHGAFVSCVAHATNAWKNAGLISGNQKGKIQSCAAKAVFPDTGGDEGVGGAGKGTKNNAAGRSVGSRSGTVNLCGLGFGALLWPTLGAMGLMSPARRSRARRRRESALQRPGRAPAR